MHEIIKDQFQRNHFANLPVFLPRRNGFFRSSRKVWGKWFLQIYAVDSLETTKVSNYVLETQEKERGRFPSGTMLGYHRDKKIASIYDSIHDSIFVIKNVACILV